VLQASRKALAAATHLSMSVSFSDGAIQCMRPLIRFDFIEARFGEIQLVKHAFIADRVDVARSIGGEGNEALRNGADLTNRLQRAVFLSYAKDAFGDVIAAHIDAVERGPLVAAIAVATRA